MSVVALKERADIPLADQIRPRLLDAERTLDGLRGQIGSLALDKTLNRPGAPAKLDKLNEQIAAAEREASQLSAALEVAETRDAATAREALHRVRLASLKDFEEALAVRTAAANDLAKSIEAASQAYRRFINSQQSLPLLLPLGVALDLNEMGIAEMGPAHLVEREMFRVGVQIDVQGLAIAKLALPGARSHDLMRLNNPESLPTLVDAVAAGTNTILSAVRDRVNALA